MGASPGDVQNIEARLGDYSNIYIFLGDSPIYPVGKAVTYIVDGSTKTYVETVKKGESCLSPLSFVPEKSGWQFVGWRSDTEANGDVLTKLLMDNEPITLYAVFKKAVTVVYHDYNIPSSTITKYRYYNNGNETNPVFTITQATISGWTTRGWSTSTAGDGYIIYGAINNIAISEDITLYSMYQQNVTLSYNGNGNTGGSTTAETKLRYYNGGSTAVVNPTFLVKTNGFVKSAYSFVRWRLNSVSGAAYAPNTTLTISSNSILYAEWTYVSAPFYIVQNDVCRQTLPWYYNTGSNIKANSFSTSGFSAGGGYPTIKAQYIDYEQNATFWAYSGSINTNGNKTLEITAVNPFGVFGFTINGVYKENTNWGTKATLTFDISSLSSFIIYVKNTTAAMSGDPYLMFNNIRLY